MFLVGSEIGNAGRKLTQPNDAGTCQRRMRRCQPPERFAHYLGGAPAEALHQLFKIATAGCIQSGLNSGFHDHSVLQIAFVLRGADSRIYRVEVGAGFEYRSIAWIKWTIDEDVATS